MDLNKHIIKCFLLFISFSHVSSSWQMRRISLSFFSLKQTTCRKQRPSLFSLGGGLNSNHSYLNQLKYICYSLQLFICSADLIHSYITDIVSKSLKHLLKNSCGSNLLLLFPMPLYNHHNFQFSTATHHHYQLSKAHCQLKKLRPKQQNSTFSSSLQNYPFPYIRKRKISVSSKYVSIQYLCLLVSPMFIDNLTFDITCWCNTLVL